MAEKGSDLGPRLTKMTPSGVPSRRSGVASIVRTVDPACLTRDTASGNSASAASMSSTWIVCRSHTTRPLTKPRLTGMGISDRHWAAQRSMPRHRAQVLPFQKPDRDIRRPADRAAFSTTASRTGWRSVGELEITRRISAVAVCCSSASFVSLNRRTFSIAITAWSAKVWSSAMCWSGSGSASRRPTPITPSVRSPWSIGTRPGSGSRRPGQPQPVRCPPGSSLDIADLDDHALPRRLRDPVSTLSRSGIATTQPSRPPAERCDERRGRFDPRRPERPSSGPRRTGARRSSTMVSNTGWTSVGELEMTRRISLVAVCCSSASVNAGLRRSTSRLQICELTAWSGWPFEGAYHTPRRTSPAGDSRAGTGDSAYRGVSRFRIVRGQPGTASAPGQPPALGVPAVPWGTGAPTLPRPGLGRQMGGSGAWFALEPVGRPHRRLRRVRTHGLRHAPDGYTPSWRPAPDPLEAPSEPAERDAVETAGKPPRPEGVSREPVMVTLDPAQSGHAVPPVRGVVPRTARSIRGQTSFAMSSMERRASAGSVQSCPV